MGRAEHKPEARQKGQNHLGPLEKWTHSPLSFGSGLLASRGVGSCNSLQCPHCLNEDGCAQAAAGGREFPLSIRRECPSTKGADALPPLAARLLDLCSEWSSREPQEKGGVPTRCHTCPDPGCLPSLGEPGEEAAEVTLCQCSRSWCNSQKVQGQALGMYFSPSHVILFLDWTQKLFGAWTNAR